MSYPPDYFRVLLVKAGQDLAAARRPNGNAEMADEIIGFYCQQTVEKAITAVLESRQVEYPPTHDLMLLLGLLDPTEPSPLSTNDALLLNQFGPRSEPGLRRGRLRPGLATRCAERGSSELTPASDPASPR
jgi:hypothetical protein